MKRSIVFLFLITMNFLVNGQDIQSPYEFLQGEYGKQFTPHHKVVDYANYIAENSNKAIIREYGRTNQQRELVQLIISSEENLKNIESLRQNHLNSLQGNGSEDKAIVWLSFGVHGNEAGGTESSLNVMYELVSGNDDKYTSYLENTIVIIDPSINPDGFSRYSHWVRNVSTKEVQPETYTREHHEPWPGGRVNHYLFDLNRDWAWTTQLESRQRIALYNTWLPHIHVDVHEMGHNSHYYFAPAAKPYHGAITDWQADFQVEIGKNNAKYFDDEGWLFFTREVFDLLYPSYGDSYPIFNGAIGMTYEQAGHSMAGRAIHMENGDTLTLQDRIDHHSTTTLSTVEMGSLNADRLINEMKKYFNDKKSTYANYVIKRPKGDNLDEMRRILDLHKIEYAQANSSQSSSGFDYKSGEEKSCKISKGDLVIPTNQMKSILLNTLFEAEPFLEDSLTYDITAWALPYAHGNEAYALKGNVSTESFKIIEAKNEIITDVTAMAFPGNLSNSHKILASLLKHKIKCRISLKSTKYENVSLGIGAIIITQADNRKNPDWRKTVNEISKNFNVNPSPISTGFANLGPDLGSSSIQYVPEVKVGTIAGEGMNNNSFGQLWHYFEREIDYPLMIIDKSDLSQKSLEELDVFVLTEGYYSFSEQELKTISDWVNQGGKLVTLGGATRLFVDKDDFSLSNKESEDKPERKASPSDVASEERAYISRSIAGAIFRAELDENHPISFGLGKTYHCLRASTSVLPMQKGLRNAGHIPSDYTSYGFVGSKVKKAQENSLVVGIESKGRGTVVYLPDNPIYRGFWKAGARLLTNAIFLVEN